MISSQVTGFTAAEQPLESGSNVVALRGALAPQFQPEPITDTDTARQTPRETLSSPGLLVVDLDGTLVHTDTLFESFWSALGRDWRGALGAARALLQGRAAVKHSLAQAAALEAEHLPYDRAVLAYIEAWRAEGGRAVLVTAADQSIADAVAAHTGLFDEAHGSDGQTNLKGARKAAFITARWGASRFAYMGDASADLPIWQHASRAITVNAPAALRRRSERVAQHTEHMRTRGFALRPYLDALRPHQWLKNLLVFLPMLAAHQISAGSLGHALAAFASFCLVASAVYVLNDLLDLNSDRAHPRKRARPFASGRLPIAHGPAMLLALGGGGLGIAMAMGPQMLAVMTGYMTLTTAYSLYLKRAAVIDILALAGLYTMRMVAGAVALGIELSAWLAAFSLFFFFALAAVKRQAELVDHKARGKTAPAGRGYSTDDLPIITMVGLGSGYLSVLVMALYVTSPAVLALYSMPQALWGICAVLLYWVTRMVLLTQRGQMHDDPVVFAARDRVSHFSALAILGFGLWAALGETLWTALT
ncbi:UbiA family prenyltransferase [Salipiger sp. CCB-MM3]|uniref:UbiA family prenyltransferase n=1 Tax=Salipiger sp. CCB-MM3 TaxID=1792508 RepID=UPI0009F1EA4D|nr:UbiA family prenyltransferase [Salipiger sp. CCB-MM3]